MSLENKNYQYIPLVAHLPSETREEFLARWDKIDKLPEIIKDKLTSDRTIEAIKQAEKNFNLNIDQITCISSTIRNYYFNTLKISDLPQMLSSEMGIDLNKSQAIANEVIKKIINDTTQETEYQSTLIKIKLNDALKKYPDMGEQLITSNRIKLKSFPEMVRPSIKNWISDYTFNAGYNKHDAIALGNYLYQNENARNLNPSDRQRLSYILKAYDENSEVTVNEKTKQIMFPLPQNQRALESNTPFPAINNSQSKTIQNDAIVDLRNRPETGKSEPKDIFSNFNTISVGSGLRPEPELKTMRFKSGDSNRPEASPNHISNPSSYTERETPRKTIQRFAAQPNPTFSSPHKFPFEKSRTAENVTHSAPQIKPSIFSQNASVPTKKTIPNLPFQPKEQKPSGPQPLIISPRRRFINPVPDYNVLNLKDKK